MTAQNQRKLNLNVINNGVIVHNHHYLFKKYQYKKSAQKIKKNKNESIVSLFFTKSSLFFNMLGQLNYSLFLFLYEIFGNFFEKNFFFASSFFKIKRQLEYDSNVSLKLK